MTEIKRTTMIYKMARLNDPDRLSGVWGNRDCMGRVRARSFHAVIGVGGCGPEPIKNGIRERLVWIGIGPKVISQAQRGPIYSFEHFLPAEREVDVRSSYPTLAAMLYDTKTYQRVPIMNVAGGNPKLDEEVKALLKMAEKAPASKWGVCRVA